MKNLKTKVWPVDKQVMFWFIIGNYYYMTPIADVENRTAVLDLKKVDESYAGIYSASYVGDSALFSAWMRLIIRGIIFSVIPLKNIHDFRWYIIVPNILSVHFQIVQRTNGAPTVIRTVRNAWMEVCAMTKTEIVFVLQGLWECAVRQVSGNHSHETDHLCL